MSAPAKTKDNNDARHQPLEPMIHEPDNDKNNIHRKDQ
jgi:hypothetical protein